MIPDISWTLESVEQLTESKRRELLIDF